MTARRSVTWALGVLALTGCRVDRIDALELADPPPAPVFSFTSIPDADVVTPEIEQLDTALREHLAVLAGPDLEGRRPGSEGAQRTVGYLVNALRSAALQPAAPGGGWQQKVPVRVYSSSGTATLLTDPPVVLDSGIVLAGSMEPGEHKIKARMLDAGFGITAKEWTLDDYATLNAEDAAVLVRLGAPAGHPADTVYSTSAYKLKRAHRAGAAACLLLAGLPEDDPQWAALTRGFSRRRVLQGEGRRVDAAVDMRALVAARVEEQLRAAVATDPETRIELEVRTEVDDLGDATVVGRIPGVDHPEQSVLVIANWDAGGTEPPTPDGGGAESNGAGVAMVLAIAERLTKWKNEGRQPRRSVTFVFTAADSLGTYGTQAFVARLGAVTREVAAAIIVDGFDIDDAEARLVAVGAERTTLEATLRDVFDDRLHQAPAGDGADSPKRPLFDTADIPAVVFTRRTEALTLTDRPYAVAMDLHDLAVEANAIFDLVWQLADAPSMPLRVAPAPGQPPAGPKPAKKRPNKPAPG